MEIAANQPNIQQKDIARKIGVTSQAVSDYVSKLEKDGWITSDGRSRYRITKEGVNWMLKSLRELQQYTSTARKCPDQYHHLAGNCRDGFEKRSTRQSRYEKRVAVRFKSSRETTPVASPFDKAKKGEDIGITDIEGILPWKSDKSPYWKSRRFKTAVPNLSTSRR